MEWNAKLVRRQCLRCCEPLSSATAGFELNMKQATQCLVCGE